MYTIDFIFILNSSIIKVDMLLNNFIIYASKKNKYDELVLNMKYAEMKNLILFLLHFCYIKWLCQLLTLIPLRRRS